MCVQVRNVETGDEAECAPELRKMLGLVVLPLWNPAVEITDDECLCPVNVEQAAIDAGWKFRIINGDSMDAEVCRAGVEWPYEPEPR